MVSTKPVWFCSDIGVDGWLMIAVDQDLAGPNEPESMFGHRRAFHPFQLDEDPQALAIAIAEMSDVMGRVSAPTQPTPRACAFSHHQEQ